MLGLFQFYVTNFVVDVVKSSCSEVHPELDHKGGGGYDF